MYLKIVWKSRANKSKDRLFHIIRGLNCIVKIILRFTGKSTDKYIPHVIKVCP
jgi:hypothetical protein